MVQMVQRPLPVPCMRCRVVCERVSKPHTGSVMGSWLDHGHSVVLTRLPLCVMDGVLTRVCLRCGTVEWVIESCAMWRGVTTSVAWVGILATESS